MKKSLLFCLCALTLSSCSMGGKHVTWETYSEVSVGDSANTVIEIVGTPYATKTLEDGSTEYEYIERFKAGYRNIQMRRYYITVKDGKVVSKRVIQNEPWPYYLEYFDSYQMQTTQNGDSASEE